MRREGGGERRILFPRPGLVFLGSSVNKCGTNLGEAPRAKNQLYQENARTAESFLERWRSSRARLARRRKSSFDGVSLKNHKHGARVVNLFSVVTSRFNSFPCPGGKLQQKIDWGLYLPFNLKNKYLKLKSFQNMPSTNREFLDLSFRSGKAFLRYLTAGIKWKRMRRSQFPPSQIYGRYRSFWRCTISKVTPPRARGLAGLTTFSHRKVVSTD